jgi:tetratricopeptide (TPR) repeat protein
MKSADAGVRAGALDLLRTSFEEARRPEEVIRVLGVALPLADAASAIALHREIGERLVAIDRSASAMEHYVALLALAPDAIDDQRRLRHLAEATGEYILYVMGLQGAADVATDGERRVALLAEAGDVQHLTLHDTAAAIELYTRVLAERSVPAATALRVARVLDGLLEETGRSAERLVVLERLGALEDAPARTQALGDAARLAESLGEPERALASWRARLGHDGDDSEALAARDPPARALGPAGPSSSASCVSAPTARSRRTSAAPTSSASLSSRPSSSTTPPPRSPPGAPSSASSARTARPSRRSPSCCPA